MEPIYTALACLINGQHGMSQCSVLAIDLLSVLRAQTVEDKIRARQEDPDAATEEAAAARELTVTFNADVNDGMPWRFLPSQRAVKVIALIE